MKNLHKTAIVTGGSSGIGKAACISLAESGYSVYALCRSDGVPAGITHVYCDVCDEVSVQTAIRCVLCKEQSIDLLVNNAGGGISGAVEFTDLNSAKSLFDLNFFGVVNVCKAVIPAMRKTGGGRIINIGSVAGELAIPFQSFYSCTKAAIHSLTLSLSNEVKPFGISVCALLPGDVRTGFTACRRKSAEGDDAYCGRIEKAVSAMEKDEENGMAPAVLGKRISKIAAKRRVKPFYSCGFKYKLFLFLAKILPVRFSNYIVGKLY